MYCWLWFSSLISPELMFASMLKTMCYCCGLLWYCAFVKNNQVFLKCFWLWGPSETVLHCMYLHCCMCVYASVYLACPPEFMAQELAIVGYCPFWTRTYIHISWIFDYCPFWTRTYTHINWIFLVTFWRRTYTHINWTCAGLRHGGKLERFCWCLVRSYLWWYWWY